MCGNARFSDTPRVERNFPSMATTDTKQGFRLPWSSDRSQDDSRPEESLEATDTAAPADTGADPAEAVNPDGSAGSEVAEEAWPEIDVNARLNLISADPSAAQSSGPISRTAKEHVAMVDSISAVAHESAAPRKPSKLIADLAAAMRSTAEAAREQALAQVEADSRQVVEAIRAQSTDGHSALRSRCDEDIVAIRDWSKAEIARVREETERRITERKATLEAEIATHAGAIERRVEDVQETVAAYEARMATFFEHLLQESDPARLAAMAESMPEPPSLEIWADLPEPAAEAEAIGTTETSTAAEAVAETKPEPESEQAVTAEVVADATGWGAEPTAAVDAQASAEASFEATDPAAAPAPEGTTTAPEPVAAASEPAPRAAQGWGDTDNAWSTKPTTSWPESDARPDQADAAWSRPAETAPDAGSHDTIMAAIEADAEAGVNAQAGSETEMLADDGSSDSEEAPSPEAEASLAARLASLIPGRGSADGDEGATAEAVTTQVVVTGLVSVASIASFKRHLGRLTGVQSVSVASGPDGEFMFNVTHRADVSFRDVIPTMPGFAARVTGGSDGIVNVTARDPEAEA